VLKIARNQGAGLTVTIYPAPGFERIITAAESAAPVAHDNVHVLDGNTRLAVVRRGPPLDDDRPPDVADLLSHHLGSSAALVAAAAALINREEYLPYGETSFGSYRLKRFRFTGRERDQETGLCYHGARYYAPWLCRWIASDPSGPVEGPNLYRYAINQPLSRI